MSKLKIIVSKDTSQFVRLLKENRNLFAVIDRNIYKKNCEMFLSVQDKEFNCVKLYFKFKDKVFSVTYFVKDLSFVEFSIYKIILENFVFIRKLVEKN
jgi:hypothetical protein